MRNGAFDPPEIPADFWSRPAVSEALASRDVGALFGLLWRYTGMSQTRIGMATGHAQGRVSDIIHGTHRVQHHSVFTRIADGLDMPAHARAVLGLSPDDDDQDQAPPAPPAYHVPGPTYPAAVGDAIAASASLWQADNARAKAALSAPLDPAAWNAAGLAWLVSRPDTDLASVTEGRAVGRSDVARVRASADLLAELDNRFGGSQARRALINFLDRDAAALLAGSYSDDTGRELHAAIAEAMLLAAWTSYDSGLHGLAQRYFVQALRLAQSAADRRLACSILSAMSHQATYLGHLTEAVNLTRAASDGLRDVATPVLTAQFRAMEARALARAGDARGCHAALTAAERAFQVPEAGRDPDFIAYFNEAELAAEASHCFRDLGDARRAAEQAALAVPSDGSYARSDFFVTMVRAHALADQGDTEQACTVALDALRIGQAVTSVRCASYAREFRDRLDILGDSPAVRDFAEQAAGHALWIKAA
jgi:tetratricopeptide (TPR) repeat protein